MPGMQDLADHNALVALQVTELSGEEAAEAISEFSGLSLVPAEPSEWTKQLERAGFTAPKSTPRSIARADMRGELLTNQGANK